MTRQSKKARRRFHAHVEARAGSLNGVLLATFWQRLLGYFVDLLLAVVVWGPVEYSWRHFLLHEKNIHMAWDFHEPGNILVMVLYWGLANYFGNGQTPGKWVARTRAMSLTGERMGLWQSIERGLGYGAAMLELGLGFLQFFWDPNRMCAQDRLAETIVVDVRKPKANAVTERAQPESEARLQQEMLVMKNGAEAEKRFGELSVKTLEDAVAHQQAQTAALEKQLADARQQVQERLKGLSRNC